MELSQHKEFQSITDFQVVDLPDFTVITGLNGSGKTHLLKAIEIGGVLIDGVAMSTGSKAKFFDASSIVPKSTGAFASITLEKLRKAELLKLTRFKENVRASLRTHLRNQLQALKQVAPNFQLGDPFDILSTDFDSSGLYTEQQLLNLNALKAQANAYVVESTSTERLRSSKIAIGLSIFSVEKNTSILQLSKDDLESAAIGVWGDVNAFQQNLGQLFVAYRDMRVKNDLKTLSKKRKPNENIRTFSDDEFVDNYGQSEVDPEFQTLV